MSPGKLGSRLEPGWEEASQLLPSIFSPCLLPRPEAGRRGRDPMAVSVWHGEWVNLVNLFLRAANCWGRRRWRGLRSPAQAPGAAGGKQWVCWSEPSAQSIAMVRPKLSLTSGPRGSRKRRDPWGPGPGPLLHLLLKNLRSGATSSRCSWHRRQG